MKRYLIGKRMMDIVLAILCLPFAMCIIAVCALFIKLETPGPIFYCQERVGLGGRYFKIYKLRSMYVDAEKYGERWALENDPRVTNAGKWMRRTRIDELPQIINILKGEMSFVGPRPERPTFTAQFEESCPGFVSRLRVKPGLTGIAQVNGGYWHTPKEKLKFDLHYIENQGLNTDIRILLKTIKIVLSGDGAR
ncbi:sugar transferase [Virgibacillus sp. FSP13]